MEHLFICSCPIALAQANEQLCDWLSMQCAAAVVKQSSDWPGLEDD